MEKDNNVIRVDKLLSRLSEQSDDPYEYIRFLGAAFKASWIPHDMFNFYLKQALRKISKKNFKEYKRYILGLLEKHTENLDIPNECIIELDRWHREILGTVRNNLQNFERVVLFSSTNRIRQPNYPEWLKKLVQDQEAKNKDTIESLLINSGGTLKYILFRHAFVRQSYKKNNIVHIKQEANTPLHNGLDKRNAKLIIENYKSWLKHVLFIVNNPKSIKRISDIELNDVNHEINHSLDFLGKILNELDETGAARVLHKFNQWQKRYAHQEALKILKSVGFKEYRAPLKLV